MARRSLFDPLPLDQLAQVHTEAWNTLFASASAVATLPWRTVQTLAGWQAPEAGPADRLAHAEQERAALAEALAAERLAHAEDAERLAMALQEAEAANEGLRSAYHALSTEAEAADAQARQDQKLALYRTIEPLLTQLPLARHALAQGRDVAASDLLALLGPLDTALAELGFSAIGEVGETVPFDAAQHQMTRGAMPDEGASVLVKHVGYRLGDQILRRARVAIATTESPEA